MNNKSEKETVHKMICIYCVGNHGAINNELCADCESLSNYTQKRLTYCQFGESKPSCEKCPIHCYNEEMRQKIKQVMRYSGPRMIYKSPILAMRHLMKGLKKS